MYELIIDEKVVEYLEKLEEKSRRRIFNKIVCAKENPFHFFLRLSDRQDYRLRVGKFRVIADINESDKSIHITAIGLRKNIYCRE